MMFMILLICHSAFSEKDMLFYRNVVQQMFYHSYDGYINHAYPYDELQPLTCDGHDTWGSYSLTLIDALDTLGVMGNKTEFSRVLQLITKRENFDEDINVSVFETNIRIVGGLLSAHLMSKRMDVEVSKFWPCKGPLLSLAVDLANRLLPAFDTPTGMPYGTVNLRHGVPEEETPVTCTACVGTYILEFATISRLTGNMIFEDVALRAMYTLWEHRSSINLLGNHVDVITGQWIAQDSGIGAGIDSYFEYLVKGSFYLQRPELMQIFVVQREAIEKYLKHEDWYLWASMTKGHITMPVFQSLEAYWPSILTLIGDVRTAEKTIFNYHQVLKQFGFTPEFYNIPQAVASNKREGYPLRPELAESLMYLYAATQDDTFVQMGADIVTAIQHSSKTQCGYATIQNVATHTLDNHMESFFLAETTKYLYLLFTPDHWLHNRGQTGVRHKVGQRHCILEAGGFFYNTEAHPFDSGALFCCMGPKVQDSALSEDNIVKIILDPWVNLGAHKGKLLRDYKEEGVGEDCVTDNDGGRDKDEIQTIDNGDYEVSNVDGEKVERIESTQHILQAHHHNETLHMLAASTTNKHLKDTINTPTQTSNDVDIKTDEIQESDKDSSSTNKGKVKLLKSTSSFYNGKWKVPRFLPLSENLDNMVETNASGMENTGITPSVSSSKFSLGSTAGQLKVGVGLGENAGITPIKQKISQKPAFALWRMKNKLAQDLSAMANRTKTSTYHILLCPCIPFTSLLNIKGQIFD